MGAALAWHLGGRAALEVLEGPGWQPRTEVVERGTGGIRRRIREGIGAR